LEPEEPTSEKEKPPQTAIEAFDRLANLAKQRDKRQMMEELIGQVIVFNDGKEYVAVSLRHIGDIDLCFLLTIDKPLEMVIVDVRLVDGKIQMNKYTGSDYDKILSDFMNNALNDLQAIKDRL